MFLIPASVISFVCACIMIHFYNSKCPGKQTLFDLFTRNALISHCLVMLSIVTYYILSIMSQEWSKEFTIVATSCIFFILINNGICMSYIPLIRYFSIFMPHVFAEIEDKIILRNFKRISLIVSMTFIFVEVFLTDNISQTLAFLILNNGYEDLPGNELKSEQMVYGTVLIFYLLLTIRLEVSNFGFNEGCIFKTIRIIKSLKMKLKMVPREEQTPGQITGRSTNLWTILF